MNRGTIFKAALAFVAWVGIAVGLGYQQQAAIVSLLGPDVWFWVALWGGSVIGLINVLLLLIRARL